MRKTFLSIIISILMISPLSNVFAYGTDYRFTGQELDPEAGLYNYGQRYYDPNVGRFTQPDPLQNYLTNPQKLKQTTGQDLEKFLENPQNLNPYSYVQNNPVKYVDPTGESVMDVIRGEQSLSQFQVEVGENAEIRYQDNKVWRTVLDNPYLFSGALAVATPLIAAGINALASGTSLLASLGLASRTLPPILISQSQRIFNSFQDLKNKEIVPRALTKLKDVSNVIGRSVNFILKEASKSESVFTDLRHGSNVNIFFQNPINSAKLIRVTLDPSLNRIISAGFNTIKQVTQWVSEGQLVNFTK